MASARELLEQADAMMRRNRARSDVTDIPVLTDVVTGTPQAAPAPPADVPVLTDVVEELVVDIVPLPAETPRSPVAFETDPFRAETRRSPAAFEGDPSDWLVMDTVDPAIHSITGRPPDTLSMVPAITFKAAGSAATPPPEASQKRSLHEVASPQKRQEPEQDAIDEAAAAPHPEDARQPVPGVEAPSEKPWDDEQATPDLFAPQPLREDGGLWDSPLQLRWPDEEFVSARGDSQLEAKNAAHEPSSEDLSRSDGDVARVPSESSPQPARDRESPASVVSLEAVQDEERWRSLAEQISMQVLQRIDLFTDTGLKEQLAAHLQPIVERAGTELVSAINEHVGRLLRAYVAEAIEREIDQWRDSQR